jgi:hypothetical protein
MQESVPSMEELGFCVISRYLCRTNHEPDLASNGLYAPRPVSTDTRERISVLVDPLLFNFAGKFTSNRIRACCQKGLTAHHRSLFYENMRLAKGIDKYALDYARLRLVINVSGDFSFDERHGLRRLAFEATCTRKRDALAR